MPNPTASDIAKILGISRGTVSRALNNSGRVSEETRNKVLETARKLNYIPNKAARALVMNKSYRVAVIIFSEPEYYWNQVKNGINRAWDELRHFSLEVEVFVADIKKPEEQIILMEKAIQDGFDAICLAPNDPQIMDEAIDEATNKGVPVLAFNVDVPSSSRICYVGCNYITAGRLAGELLGKLLNRKGKVAVLTFSANIVSIQQRIIGFRESIAQFPGIEVLGPYKFKRTGEDAYDLTRELLRNVPDLDGIFVSFGILDEVANSLIDEGRDKDVKVVGYDLSESIKNYLKQDVIDAVITHEPFAQGYFSIKILHKYLAEKVKPAKTIINTKIEAVFKENVNYYLDEAEHYEILFK